MARIVATAENFAFGPAGKLITVAERLAGLSHQLTFVGYGTALQLAERSSFWQSVEECDTDGDAFQDVAGPLLSDADLLLCCVDRSSARLARRLGTPVVWLDPLHWWWGDEQPIRADDLALHIAQRSIETPHRAPAEGAPGRYLEVGPIVGPVPGRTRREGSTDLLVNFGGGEAAGWYAPGRETDYPYMIIDLLVSEVDLSPFDSVTVTSGEHIAAECRRRWPDSSLSFSCLEHGEFLRRLANASAFLTVPGLEAPLEAWMLGVPTIFLPPSNSSQYVQLDEYRDRGVGGASVHLKDYLPSLDLMDLPLRERSELFLAQLSRLEKSPELRSSVGKAIESLIHNRASWSTLVRRGDDYMDALGRDGLDRCVDAITELIRVIGD